MDATDHADMLRELKSLVQILDQTALRLAATERERDEARAEVARLQYDVGTLRHQLFEAHGRIGNALA